MLNIQSFLYLRSNEQTKVLWGLFDSKPGFMSIALMMWWKEARGIR
jgi:hypothetical protein